MIRHEHHVHAGFDDPYCCRCTGDECVTAAAVQVVDQFDHRINEAWRQLQRALSRRRVAPRTARLSPLERRDGIRVVAHLVCKTCREPVHPGQCRTPASQALFTNRAV